MIHITKWDLLEGWEKVRALIFLPVFLAVSFISRILRSRPVRSRKPKVMIFYYGGLGDHFFALPLMTEIKRKYPDSTITVLTNAGKADQWLNPVSASVHLKKRILPFSGLVYKGFHKWILFSNAFPLIARVFFQNPDISISIGAGPHWAAIGAFIFYSGGAKKRLASEHLDPLHYHYLSSPPVKAPKENVRVSYLLSLPWITNVDDARKLAGACFSNQIREDQASLHKLLAEKGCDLKRRKVVIHPGGKEGVNLRQWPVERYADLIKRISAAFDTDVFITGSAEEKSFLDPRQNGFLRVTNLCGETPVSILLALLKDSALVVTNDTGVLHMAGAISENPIIGIFGPTTPERVAPLTANTEVISPLIDCAPCIAFDASDPASRCKNAVLYACIYENDVDRVWAAAKNALALKGAQE